MKTIKPILLNIMLFHSIFTFGQDKNPLLSEIEKNKNKKIDSLISFNTDKNKLQYLAVLPSINYDFLDKTFNVGISLSNLSNFYQNKQRNKIELEKLKFQLIEKKENDLFELEKEYELIQDTYEVLKLELENTTLTKEIFNLKKAQYENNKITLEDWLNVQKNFQDRNLVILAKRKNLISKMKQFEVKIKSPCLKKELEYLSMNATNQ
ncbi:hypothetical protein FNW12_16935 [Flavobacterium gawalongense]|uniref:TolC family protein n=1 Tax=Flavobacterium gawalongense TaxID=2594432 RepID=A0ABY3CF44_9FLAO|nr:TolC family protein [Flavobacterium gawalongense]TRX01658.1 hypothetical protein FNW12_16935 [Flavobacterium gawalongense]